MWRLRGSVGPETRDHALSGQRRRQTFSQLLPSRPERRQVCPIRETFAQLLRRQKVGLVSIHRESRFKKLFRSMSEIPVDKLFPWAHDGDGDILFDQAPCRVYVHQCENPFDFAIQVPFIDPLVLAASLPLLSKRTKPSSGRPNTKRRCSLVVCPNWKNRRPPKERRLELLVENRNLRKRGNPHQWRRHLPKVVRRQETNGRVNLPPRAVVGPDDIRRASRAIQYPWKRFVLLSFIISVISRWLFKNILDSSGSSPREGKGYETGKSA